MKALLFCTFILLSVVTSHAQIKPNQTVSLSEFESTLVQGNLTLTKTYKQGDGDKVVITYHIARSNDPDAGSRKPEKISLTKAAFDDYFTKNAAALGNRLQVLNQFITDNHISMEEEKGWVAVLKHYNNIR